MICPFLQTIFLLLQYFQSVCLLVKYITSKYRVKKKDENNFLCFHFLDLFLLTLIQMKRPLQHCPLPKIFHYKEPKTRFGLFCYLLKIFNIPIVICPILATESIIHLVTRCCCWIAQKRIYNLVKRQPT